MAPVFAQLGQAFSELWGQIAAVVQVLLGSGAAVPFDRFESFGAMLADLAGGALRWVVQGITEVVRVMTWLIGTIRAFHASPFGSIFRTYVGALILGVTWIFRLGRALQWLGSWLNPLVLIWRALSAIGGFFGLGGGEAPQETGNPAQELTRGRRAREESDRTEAATARPAASEAEGRNDSTAAILAQLEEGRRGEGTTRIQNNVQLQAEGRTLAEIVQEYQIDGATGAGGIVTDDFGFTPAPA
jgi:ABC-type multidrug transport system fused ATPase/permease subunit